MKIKTTLLMMFAAIFGVVVSAWAQPPRDQEKRNEQPERPAMGVMFERWDTNHDGMIDRQEFEAGFSKMHQMRGRFDGENGPNSFERQIRSDANPMVKRSPMRGGDESRPNHPMQNQHREMKQETPVPQMGAGMPFAPHMDGRPHPEPGFAKNEMFGAPHEQPGMPFFPQQFGASFAHHWGSQHANRPIIIIVDHNMAKKFGVGNFDKMVHRPKKSGAHKYDAAKHGERKGDPKPFHGKTPGKKTELKIEAKPSLPDKHKEATETSAEITSTLE